MKPALHGIFGGTFDPIHHGHLAPLREVFAAGALADITYIPTAHPPHRAPPVAAAEHRLAMTRIALAECAAPFVADDIELQRDAPSYTIDTLHELQQRDRQKNFALIIGMDALRDLETWHRWRELVASVHIIALARDGDGHGDDFDLPSWVDAARVESLLALHESNAGKVFIADTQTLPVSSTQIRARIKAGESIAGLTPDGVCNYIQQNNLYAN